MDRYLIPDIRYFVVLVYYGCPVWTFEGYFCQLSFLFISIKHLASINRTELHDQRLTNVTLIFMIILLPVYTFDTVLIFHKKNTSIFFEEIRSLKTNSGFVHICLINLRAFQYSSSKTKIPWNFAKHWFILQMFSFTLIIYWCCLNSEWIKLCKIYFGRSKIISWININNNT